jgi:hypothetical protein
VAWLVLEHNILMPLILRAKGQRGFPARLEAFSTGQRTQAMKCRSIWAKTRSVVSTVAVDISICSFRQVICQSALRGATASAL